MVSRVIPVDPFDLTIFGGTGDLAKRKILPGLFRRHLSGQMPHEAQIIGAARSELSDEEYRDIVRAAIAEFGAIDHSDRDVNEFLSRVSYLHVDAKGSGIWPNACMIMISRNVTAASLLKNPLARIRKPRVR
jgi:glucose-6-phosphate 1-dehydrogenase